MEEFLCGFPAAFWETVGNPPRSLILSGCLDPFLTRLAFHLARISDQVVHLQVSGADGEPVFSFDGQTIITALAAAQDLPLPEAQFDLVVSSWCAHYSPDPHAHLREIVRVLKPGGTFLFTDGLDAKGTPAQQLHHSLHTLTMEIDQALTRRQIAFFSATEILELFHNAGFSEPQALKVAQTSQILSGSDLETLRGQVMQTLSSVYLPKLGQIPGGQRRWGNRLTGLLQDLQTAPLEPHPYLVVRGQKPALDEDRPARRSAGIRGKLSAESKKYLIADENAGYPVSFRDLPDEFKPREKLVMHGPAALKNHELLAVLLVSGTTKENVLELSRRLIQEYGSRAIAQERSVRRLQETLGIGMNKACQIVSAFELGRRFFEEPSRKAPTILAADDAYEYLHDMAKFTKEHFRGLYLNTRNRIIRDEIISIGTLNMSVVHPREVFLPAVEFSAAAIIMAHNHPSGDPTPSEEDLAITRQMVEAGKVMGIEVFDHLIIGEDCYVSLQQEGKLK